MFRKKKTLEQVKKENQSKLKDAPMSYKYVILNQEFLSLRQDIDKAMKSQVLDTEIITKFSKKISEYSTFLKSNKTKLQKENKKLTDKNFKELHSHLDKSLIWCNNQLALFKDKVKKEK